MRDHSHNDDYNDDYQDYPDYDEYDDFDDERERGRRREREDRRYDDRPARPRRKRPARDEYHERYDDDYDDYYDEQPRERPHPRQHPTKRPRSRPEARPRNDGPSDHRRPKPRRRASEPRKQKAAQDHKKKNERRSFFKKRPHKKVAKSAPKTQRKGSLGAVGIRRKTTWLCWLLLLGSFSFAVYKNFTAIDTHTVHERQVVRTKMVDTNAMSTFVTDFAKVYYAWAPDHEVLDGRQKALGNYLTDNLVMLNADTLRSDIPTTSTVNDVKIWSVTHLKGVQYRVLYTVEQSIKNSADEDANKDTSSTYTVQLARNANGDMVIDSNPTIAAAPAKGTHKDKVDQTDSSINSDTTDSISKFLTTFFKLYPSGSANELKYYVNGGTKAINKNYRFAELQNPTFHRIDDNIRVNVTVKYLDTDTDMVQYSQYDLIISKNGNNWTIESGL